MKAKLIFTSILIVLIIAVIAGGYIAYSNYSSYNLVTEQIYTIEENKMITIDSDIDYKNTEIKVNNEQLEEDFYYGYESIYERDGILYFSTTKSWDEEKLSELADELYKNTHGEEINYLEKVVVYGSYGGYAAGSHSMGTYAYEMPISYYNFFPSEQTINSYYDKSSIYIYDVGAKTTIEDIAVVLSHEYGHHFTFYHFGLDGTANDADTEYYSLRAEGNLNVIYEREKYQNYIDEHKWYLVEIAAEDYVYLMGSETTHNVIEYIDNYQKYNLYRAGNYTALALNDEDVSQCINVIPHENVDMLLPSEIEGLADYYYSFVDEKSPLQTPIDDIGTLSLQMERVPDDQFNFTWEQPYTDSDVIYTLIGYNEEGRILVAVKTTYGDEEGAARFGDYSSMQTRSEQYEDLYAYDWSEGEIMMFRVSITFPDGTVIISDPVTFIS